MLPSPISHYQDVVLQEASLSQEIWGRVVWSIHWHLKHADFPRSQCRLDFPDFDHRGVGRTCRLFGDEELLASVGRHIAPLQGHGFIELAPAQAVPGYAAEWAVVTRAKSKGPARERRHARRAAARALKNGDPLPDVAAPKGGRTWQNRETPAHTVSMMSHSSGKQVFPLLLTRKVTSDADEAHGWEQGLRNGASYGLSQPVPLIPPMGESEELPQ